MSIKELVTVVLETNLADYDLKQGDIGGVVHIYSPDAIEVEFVTVSGHTQALVALTLKQIRPIGRNDVLAVGQANAA